MAFPAPRAASVIPTPHTSSDRPGDRGLAPAALDRPLSTISGILTRIGMGRLGGLGLEPAQRYERSRPGELIHIDVKKLGRIVGGAGKRVRGGAHHYTGSYTDATGTRRNKA